MEDPASTKRFEGSPGRGIEQPPRLLGDRSVAAQKVGARPSSRNCFSRQAVSPTLAGRRRYPLGLRLCRRDVQALSSVRPKLVLLDGGRPLFRACSAEFS